MVKYNVGVGDDFPVEEPPPRGPGSNKRGGERESGHGHGPWHRGRHDRIGFLLHGLSRVALIALAVAGIVWLLRPQPSAYVYGPYLHHPHFFFGPLIFVLIVLALFAHRRHHGHAHHWNGHHGHGHHGHGHHGRFRGRHGRDRDHGEA